MPKKGKPRIDGSMHGLADKLEGCPKLRRRTLKTKSIMTWVKKEQMGVMNMENIALNCEVMEILINLWAPQWQEHVMIPVDTIKPEARFLIVFSLTMFDL